MSEECRSEHFPAYQVHLCLVSDQPLPNLIPVMAAPDPPELVVLLVSPAMKMRAAMLAKSFSDLGCQTEEIAIAPYDIDRIRETVLGVLSSLDGRRVVLNATGGTKIMAMGAYDVFREMGCDAFYVDTLNGKIISVLPQSAIAPLPEIIRVKSYLSAYGYRIRQTGCCQVAVKRQELAERIIAGAKRFAPALTILNACAGAAKEQKRLSGKLEDRHLSFSILMELADLFEQAEILEREGAWLKFADEDALFFANGGWLEEHLVKLFNRLKGEKIIHDHQCNVQVETQSGLRNEIDLAFTAGNRLHLIEAKTGRLGEKEGRESRADGVAYKLDNLRDLMGGTLGRAMLVSYQNLKSIDRTRCRENGIEVVEGADLRNLEERLRDWIGVGRNG
ncbi:MAG: DUF1887 family CARF protein [Syntrophotalea sp.]|uniref:Card1-like endonuclease domain-containing protein n=1 Tax=Syntrophotalea sp. TaxID=2812029 RepID=UPI003D0E2F83